MATLLLTEQPDGGYVTSHVSQTRLRMLVRMRAELQEIIGMQTYWDIEAGADSRPADRT